ncbi:phage/plasmid primase, P4 family [Maledivibacter halophilus]|uniref:Phage/plasmid primase, P4 family, C-terminal domain-containing protein n=1 Tax=Maledivibacter halophilus TaxID=36842 RepID=A0A1T5K2U8_9FIRM|nr:phage/plasmid primase, P4 family [Maledivibacter halophilus]SKC57963.1 phage/plasmid primase, P4 family, C-terminal domain-containing protein [Maledivibacter halophilus]
MKLYVSNTRGDIKNCLYSNEVIVTDTRSLEKAAQHDHVMAKYKNNYRSKGNFVESDCIAMDLDNDYSDNPKDWKDIGDLKDVFKDVEFAVVYSRNHMKEKENKAPRPRLHIYFPIPRVTDIKEYESLKERLAYYYPFFDRNALDGARLFFGVENPVVEIVSGRKLVTELLEDDFEAWDAAQDEIQEGNRNNTMSHYAGRVLIRYGNTEQAKELFNKKAELCSPPLPDEELEQIWQSALKFGKKISSNEDYIPPEKYNTEFNLKPSEYSDVGQAEVFVREYEDRLRYSPSTKYLVYNDGYWEESDLKAHGLSQDLANRQVEEADIALKKARDEMRKNGALGLLESLTTKKAVSLFSKEQTHSYNQYLMAENYKKYAIKRGDTRAIHATTKEAMPMLEIEQKELDQDEFLLNTPSYTIDLRTGEKMEHDPLHFITKQTMVDPSDEGKSLWEEALGTFFCGDDELMNYVQKVAGLATIGKVYVEALIIAYGEGRNGKSTFWNVIARVLGSYSGSISADILTVGCKRNAKPELAEARGKRLLIAAELEEGMRLSTSNVKQLSSTDEIHAEKKYKAPFKFTPSHTLVLYTNHLPKVGAMDEGTWRRLIVIPFEAKIEGKSDIKNYSDYLFHNAGGAILKWVIDGAKKAIEDDYKFKLPVKVESAINKYKSDNDWISRFFEDCCEIDESFSSKSGEFYSEYRAFCMRTGEYARSTSDFYNALETEGFERKRTSKGSFVLGIRLKSEFI